MANISINDITTSNETGTATFTVTLSEAVGSDVTVDFTTSSQTLNFTAADIFTSAEVVEDIRAIAYNPFSTTAEQVGDIVKDEMYKAAGANSIFGINILDLYEFGDGQKYNTLYTAMGGTLTGSQQIIVGVDRSAEAFVRPVARGEGGETFTAVPDDQFYAARQEKMGFYGFLEEGRVCLDARAIVGINLRDND